MVKTKTVLLAGTSLAIIGGGIIYLNWLGKERKKVFGDGFEKGFAPWDGYNNVMIDTESPHSGQYAMHSRNLWYAGCYKTIPPASVYRLEGKYKINNILLADGYFISLMDFAVDPWNTLNVGVHNIGGTYYFATKIVHWSGKTSEAVSAVVLSLRNWYRLALRADTATATWASALLVGNLPKASTSLDVGGFAEMKQAYVGSYGGFWGSINYYADDIAVYSI